MILTMSKEAIINRILSDAQLKADSFVGDAQSKADEILAEAAEQCKAYLFSSQNETDKICDEIESRGKIVAELDAKKLQLGAKAHILDSVFYRALDKVRNLDVKNYKRLLLGMLELAEDGDVITISEREKDILTQKDIEKFSKTKGINLVLSDVFGDFDGGMILSGKGIDKNLTFEVEINALREISETEIAKEIFG